MNLHDMLKKNKKDKTFKLSILIGVLVLFLCIVSATFAYFSVMYDNTGIKNNKVDGSAAEIAKPTIVTNIEELKINLDSKLMDQTKAGTTYYATPNGTPVTTATLGSGRYTLATANVSSGNVVYNCNYTYNVSGTVTKAITDGSDENVKITFKSPSGEEATYTLKQVLAGVEYEGIISKLKVGTNQTIEVSAYVENTSNKQDDLVGNVFTFKIEMTSGEEGFSCDEHASYNVAKESKGQAAATFMATNQAKIEGLWSSGLEGDGLRYVGSGAYNGDTTPSNFICFGTTSASECKANEDKYMYRIIGVFPDEQGNQHLKLRKFKQLGTKAWNSTPADVNWGESTLYTYLNGTGFLENATYSYLQDDSWSDKIVEWKWTAVNTLTNSNSGPNYYNGSTMTPANIYLHEMNKSTKTSEVGEWTYPTGKIGLIYASDYALSLGDEALAITGSTSSNSAKLKTGWLHYTNNLASSSSAFDWTLARLGARSGSFFACSVHSTGDVGNYSVAGAYGVAPVFYLTSNTTISGGMGTYSEPFIIG